MYPFLSLCCLLTLRHLCCTSLCQPLCLRKCGLLPTSVDAELVVLHKNGVLVAIIAKHVDDLKIAGRREVVLAILKEIQAVLGDLKIEWHTFTNCGVKHTQNPQTFEISLDQAEYIKGIKVITHSDLRNKNTNDKFDDGKNDWKKNIA